MSATILLEGQMFRPVFGKRTEHQREGVIMQYESMCIFEIEQEDV